jgi:hypothetical protein
VRQWRLRRQLERDYWRSLETNAEPHPLPALAEPDPEPDEPEEAPSAAPVEPTRWPLPGQTILNRRGILLGYSLLAVGLFICSWPAIGVSVGAPAVRSRLHNRLAALSADSMPETSGPFRRKSFHAEQRQTGSEFGECSRTWRYGFGPHLAFVSVDFVFPGWHELTSCYANGGWTAHTRVRGNQPEIPVEANFTKGTGEYGTLFFSVIDARGVVVSPSLRQRWIDRIAVWREPSWAGLQERFKERGKYYQVQLYTLSGRPLTSEERAEAIHFFRAVRERAREEAGHAGPKTP